MKHLLGLHLTSSSAIPLLHQHICEIQLSHTFIISLSKSWLCKCRWGQDSRRLWSLKVWENHYLNGREGWRTKKVPLMHSLVLQHQQHHWSLCWVEWTSQIHVAWSVRKEVPQGLIKTFVSLALVLMMCQRSNAMHHFQVMKIMMYNMICLPLHCLETALLVLWTVVWWIELNWIGVHFITSSHAICSL